MKHLLKKALNTPPLKGNEDDITPPIQITFLSEGKEVSSTEFSNADFLAIIAKQTEVLNCTGCRITIDDGKKSYSFTLNVDDFVENKTEVNKPMK